MGCIQVSMQYLTMEAPLFLCQTLCLDQEIVLSLVGSKIFFGLLYSWKDRDCCGCSSGGGVGWMEEE